MLKTTRSHDQMIANLSHKKEKGKFCIKFIFKLCKCQFASKGGMEGWGWGVRAGQWGLDFPVCTNPVPPSCLELPSCMPDQVLNII